MEIHFELCMTQTVIMIILQDRRFCMLHMGVWRVRVALIRIFKIECDFRRMKNHTPLPSSLFTRNPTETVH